MPDLTAKQDEHLRKIAKAEDEEMATLTEAQRIHFAGFAGRAIARILWPDSPAWNRRTRGSNARAGGNAMAGTMPMLGAKAARTLQDHGLLVEESSSIHQSSWRLSRRGRRYLEEHANA